MAKLTVRLRVNGAIRIEETFVPSRSGDAVEIPVRPVIPGNARDVVLTVTNESENFVLVTSAVLSERAAGE
jgi:P pilus assembly chaperone PapD